MEIAVPSPMSSSRLASGTAGGTRVRLRATHRVSAWLKGPPSTLLKVSGIVTQGEDIMSVKAAVIAQIQQIADDNRKSLPALTDDLVLLDSGLDSLAIAILVARLEETLGFDPFTESNDVAYPVTLGDFIRFYEHAAASHGVDSSQPG